MTTSILDTLMLHLTIGGIIGIGLAILLLYVIEKVFRPSDEDMELIATILGGAFSIVGVFLVAILLTA